MAGRAMGAAWRYLAIGFGTVVACLLSPASVDAAAPETTRWIQNHRPTTVWADAQGARALAPAPQWTFFRIAGPQVRMRLPVVDERIGRTAWIEALDVGPTGPPPPPTPDADPAPAPPPPLAVPRPEARPIGLSAIAVAPPRPQSVGGGHRWIDVDLATQRLRLMEGDRVVRAIPVTTGKAGFRTPTGTFRILYRVENDTMDSQTVGIDRASAEGYLLKGVRYSQYFAEGGFALHTNYWQPPSVFGNAPTSHGCVGMQEADAEVVWAFASPGMVVHVH